MTRLMVFIISMMTIFWAHSSVNLVKQGDVFQGNESYNGKLTSRSCYLQIEAIEQQENKGLHCHFLYAKFLFSTHQEKIQKFEMKLSSDVSFYREGERTCAYLVNPQTDDDQSVFGQNTQVLYNKLFSAKTGNWWKQTHYFIKFSKNKWPKESKVHFVGPLLVRDWECLDLRLVN